MNRWPNIRGVARDPNMPNALAVYFERELTDDELRAFHDANGRRLPSTVTEREDAERLAFVAEHLQREAQIQLPEGKRDCWAWAISSATPDLRAAIDAIRATTKEARRDG